MKPGKMKEDDEELPVVNPTNKPIKISLICGSIENDTIVGKKEPNEDVIKESLAPILARIIEL